MTPSRRENPLRPAGVPLGKRAHLAVAAHVQEACPYRPPVNLGLTRQQAVKSLKCAFQRDNSFFCECHRWILSRWSHRVRFSIEEDDSSGEQLGDMFSG